MTTDTTDHTREPMTNPTSPPDRYEAPGAFAAKVFNPVVAWLTRRGVSLLGSRVLEVRGRSSGEWRSVPVNLLTLEGEDFLVAPRGTTQWVRNLRVAGEGRLRVGRRVTDFVAEEVGDDDKPAVLRRYLQRWKWEVGAFFDGVGPEATDDELRAISPNYPVFRVTAR